MKGECNFVALHWFALPEGVILFDVAEQRHREGEVDPVVGLSLVVVEEPEAGGSFPAGVHQPVVRNGFVQAAAGICQAIAHEKEASTR